MAQFAIEILDGVESLSSEISTDGSFERYYPDIGKTFLSCYAGEQEFIGE